MGGKFKNALKQQKKKEALSNKKRMKPKSDERLRFNNGKSLNEISNSYGILVPEEERKREEIGIEAKEEQLERGKRGERGERRRIRQRNK